MDVVILRAIERIIVAFGGIFSIYLGYRLFMEGIQKGRGELKAESKFFTLLFSGVGPGLFFMFTGGLVLLTSLFTGHATREETIENDKRRRVHVYNCPPPPRILRASPPPLFIRRLPPDTLSIQPPLLIRRELLFEEPSRILLYSDIRK